MPCLPGDPAAGRMLWVVPPRRHGSQSPRPPREAYGRVLGAQVLGPLDGELDQVRGHEPLELVDMLMALGTYPLSVLRSPAVSPPGWAWTQRSAPALTCSPRCAWRWRPSVHVPTPARYAAARQLRPLN